MKLKKLITSVLVCISTFIYSQEEFYPYGGVAGKLKPVCGCYVKADCNQKVAHCTYNTCTSKGKLDGICVKNSFSSWDSDLLIRPVLIEISSRFDLWFASLNRNGGEPNPALVNLAMDTTNLTKAQVELIKLKFFGLIVPLWVGNYVATNLPAKKGFWMHPLDTLGFNNGYLHPITDDLVQVGKMIQKGVTGSIINGNKNYFDNTFEKIRVKYPNFISFGRCEYPHPIEHGHADDYPDAITCMKEEIEPAIAALFKEKVGNKKDSQIENEIILKISPNPFSENATLTFGSFREEDIEVDAILSVRDMSNSFSNILWQGKITTNGQQFQVISASNLNGYGAYIFTLELLDNSQSKQIRAIFVP